jgi:hypothetical protein
LFTCRRLAQQVVQRAQQLIKGDQGGLGKMHGKLSSFDLKLD